MVVTVTSVFVRKTIQCIIAGLINCENPDILDACLGIAETLIRSKPDGLKPVSFTVDICLIHIVCPTIFFV